MTAVIFTARSKTGPIPVTTSSAETCPADCPFQSQGCYAKSGPFSFLWSSATKAGPNATFQNVLLSLNCEGSSHDGCKDL